MSDSHPGRLDPTDWLPSLIFHRGEAERHMRAAAIHSRQATEIEALIEEAQRDKEGRR